MRRYEVSRSRLRRVCIGGWTMAWPKRLQTLCPAYLLRSLDRAMVMDLIAVNGLIGIDLLVDDLRADEEQESETEE